MPNSNDLEASLSREIGITLPTSYSRFLDGIAERLRISEINEGPILDFRGQEWRPYAREELSKPIQYNKGTPRPQAHETAAIAEMLFKDGNAHSSELTSALLENDFTEDRLAGGFCIGDDGNGEPVFVDAQTGAVFVYNHDGMDVELMADTLDELLSESLDSSGEADDE